MKRLGYLFETLAPRLPDKAKHVLEAWQKELTAGISPLQPFANRSGRISTRWEILISPGLAA